MADETTENFVEMSDEDFLKQAPPTFEVQDEEGNATADDNTGDLDTNGDATDPGSDADESGDGDDAQGSDDNAGSNDDDSGEADDAGDAADPHASKGKDDDAQQDADKADADDPDADKSDDASAVDYEAEYKKLLSPFTANGKQIQVDNVDDAVRLMKMGANYHKKMATLKPTLKIVKLLDHAGLMDEGKVNYLIDLHSKNPAAITQLLKDADINPMNVDMDAESEYTPQARKVSDQELELDEVLESIQDSPTYDRTITALTKEWDEPSQRTILQTPSLISVIDDHMASGDFDQVTSLVARDRALGKLQGLSDLEAYYKVGDALAKQGHLKSQQSKEPTNNSLQSPPEKPGPSKDQVRRKKKSATVSRTKPSVQKSTEVPNLLDMPDEEFAKLSSPPYKQL